MTFSIIAEALLRAHLPEAEWTPLVTKFGYAAGFLIVILGRQQLFTEQTLTAILPMLAGRPLGSLGNVARLWVVVLAANIVGTAIVAATLAWTTAFPPDVHRALSHIGHAAMSHDVGTTFVRGLFAGYLIAVMVWLLPGADAAKLWIVLLLTYLVGLGAFSHIIAGSAECLYLVFTGQRSIVDYFVVFFAPTLVGNAIGGVVFVASLAHAQHSE
jgi:formate-nitrite transporter family protein